LVIDRLLGDLHGLRKLLHGQAQAVLVCDDGLCHQAHYSLHPGQKKVKQQAESDAYARKKATTPRSLKSYPPAHAKKAKATAGMHEPIYRFIGLAPL
jgi:hypothetical protein